MTAKLNRDEILRELLKTLVAGWSYSAVLEALNDLESAQNSRIKRRGNKDRTDRDSTAVQIVASMSMPSEKKYLLLQLAERFDQGIAFPKIIDVRSFLIAHHRDSKDLKGRSQAFKRMIPVLLEMSEKGLEKVISRSHHSGPAELEAISNAIRGAGEDLRGVRNIDEAPRHEGKTDTDALP